MADTLPELTINPDAAYFILTKAREFDEKVEDTDPDSGSNPSDDGGVDILEAGPDDATYEELASAIASLNDDEQLDLIALIWLGREDFTLSEWNEARGAARDIGRARLPRYVSEIPLVSDYIEDGLSQFGLSLEDYLKEPEAQPS